MIKSGTNYFGKLNQYVNISQTNEFGYGIIVDCFGDPNVVAMTPNVFNTGCILVRNDILIGNNLYSNSGTTLNPSWVLINGGIEAVSTDNITIKGDGTPGNPISLEKVFTDGTTIGGNGTAASPITSLVADAGLVTVSGTVNGSNLNFTVPAGITVYQLFDGTQYQTAGVNYNQVGTAITFTAGNAPSVVLTAFGGIAIANSGNYYTIAQLQSFIGSGTIVTNVLLPEPKSSCAPGFTTSTFSGWAFPIGAPQNFNRVTLNIGARTTAITSITWTITDINLAGATVASGVWTGTIPSNTYNDVQFNFTEVINSNGTNLLFAFACNEFCNILCSESIIPYPTPTYTQAAYITNGSTNFNNFQYSSPNVFLWQQIDYTVSGLVPDQAFSNEVIAASTTAVVASTFNQTSLIPISNSYIADSISLSPTPTFLGPSNEEATSTFSGWGSAIGAPQNFNGIKFRIINRSTSTITTVQLTLRTVSYNGTIVEQDNIPLNIPAGGTIDYTWLLTIGNYANAGAAQLYFSYACDQFVTLYGTESNTIFPSGGQTTYYTSGSQSPVLSSLPFLIYCNTGTYISLVGTSAAMNQYLISQLGISSNLPTVTFNLNSQTYCVVGIESNIYPANIISASFGLSDITYVVTCTHGELLGNRWTYIPLVGDIGTAAFTLTAYYKGAIIATASSTLIIKNSTVGTGSSVQVNTWGDSTLSANQYISQIYTSYDTNPTINFVGTVGTVANQKAEGRSGYSYSDYATVGRTIYTFIVSGVTVVPVLGATYTNNGQTFTVTGANVTSGSGNVEFTGTGAPTSSGTLTKTSGAGDATVSFSSESTSSANPLWNPSTSALDVNYYETNSGITLISGDIVCFNLGINDVFFGASSSTLATIVSEITALITAFQAAVPGIKFGIGIVIPPVISQDGFGLNYGTSYTMWQYYTYNQALNAALLATFDTSAMRAAGVYTVPFNINIDRYWNMQYQQAAVNARNSTTAQQWINGVHPATTGYNQMADTFYCFIKSFFS